MPCNTLADRFINPWRFYRLSIHAQQAFIKGKDTGIGIPAPGLAHIFERFYRVNTECIRSGGFGLGLAIAQQVVQAHGGEITLASTVGKGSKFQVILSIAIVPSPLGSSSRTSID